MRENLEELLYHFRWMSLKDEASLTWSRRGLLLFTLPVTFVSTVSYTSSNSQEWNSAATA